MRDGLLRLAMLLPLAAALLTGCASPQRPPGPSARQSVSPSPTERAAVPDADASRPPSVGTLFDEPPAARADASPQPRVTSPASAGPSRAPAEPRPEAPPETPAESSLTSGLKKLLNPFGSAPVQPRPLPRTDLSADRAPSEPSVPDGPSANGRPRPERTAPQPQGFAF